MMTLDEALAHRGPRIAAWDRYRGNPTALRIVAIEDGRATVIARETIPTAAQPDFERRMRERGILIGATSEAHRGDARGMRPA